MKFLEQSELTKLNFSSQVSKGEIVEFYTHLSQNKSVREIDGIPVGTVLSSLKAKYPKDIAIIDTLGVSYQNELRQQRKEKSAASNRGGIDNSVFSRDRYNKQHKSNDCDGCTEPKQKTKVPSMPVLGGGTTADLGKVNPVPQVEPVLVDPKNEEAFSNLLGITSKNKFKELLRTETNNNPDLELGQLDVWSEFLSGEPVVSRENINQSIGEVYKKLTDYKRSKSA